MGAGTEAKTGTESRMEIGEGDDIEERSGIRSNRTEAEKKIGHFHSARGNTSVNRRWWLKVAGRFGHKTRRLSGDVIPRGEPGEKDGREETETRTETGTGTMTRSGTGTRPGTGAEMGAGTGTRTEKRAEGREIPGSDSIGGETGLRM